MRNFGIFCFRTLVFLVTLGTSYLGAMDRVLLPIVLTEGALGANGAVWKTDLIIENYGDADWGARFSSGCSFDGTEIPAHTTAVNSFCSSTGTALINTDDFQLLRFYLKIKDVRSQVESAGTELPVVHESEFRRGASTTLGIPTSTRFRRMLRIYNLSGSNPLTFTLKVHPLTLSDTIFETRGEVRRRRFTDYPELLVISDGLNDPLLEPLQTVKIEIIPDDPEVPYWWFVSVTANATNALTLCSPH